MRAALANPPLTIDEIQEATDHQSVDILIAYRHTAWTATDSATRSMLFSAAAQARRAGMTPQQIADAVTGHRGDTTGLYLRREELFDKTDEDTDGQ